MIGKLWTAQFSYRGPDRLDITSRAKHIFSPTYSIVKPYLDIADTGDRIAIENAKITYAIGYGKIIGALAPGAIQGFIQQLEDQKEITMVCYCNVMKTGFCHRLIIANYLAETFGINYMGER